jgi:quercetin dioxygenase-like cupin family protein
MSDHSSSSPRRVTKEDNPRLRTAEDSQRVDLGAFGARFLVWSEESGGAFSMVEHPIPPHTLAAPLHRHSHSHEDEYSVVLEGRLGVLLENDVIHANPGDVVFKPRGQWHTFWNAGDVECRMLEVISPGGFEHMFREMGQDTDAFVGDAAAGMDTRYGLEVDYDSIDHLCREHGLTFPEE